VYNILTDKTKQNMKTTHLTFLSSIILFITSCEDNSDPSIRFLKPDNTSFSSLPAEISLNNSLTLSEDVMHIFTVDDIKLRSITGFKEVNGAAKEELTLHEFAIYMDDVGNGEAKHAWFVTTDSAIAAKHHIPKYKIGDEITITVEAEDGVSNVTNASIKVIIK
jgi:hypothetical protein